MSKVDGISDMALASGSVWGEFIRGTMTSASTFVLEKAAPPALTLMPDTSVSPHRYLVSFELLSQHWSSVEV